MTLFRIKDMMRRGPITNRMMNLAPNNDDYKIKAHSSLSTMLITMGDYPRAIEENNRILAIDPSNENAKATITYIQAAQKNAVQRLIPMRSPVSSAMHQARQYGRIGQGQGYGCRSMDQCQR